MHTIAQLLQTCRIAPAQWEGRTTENRPIYIRGKHEIVSVHIGPPGGSVDDAIVGEELVYLSHEYADVLSFDDLRLLLKDTLDFSQLRST